MSSAQRWRSARRRYRRRRPSADVLLAAGGRRSAAVQAVPSSEGGPPVRVSLVSVHRSLGSTEDQPVQRPNAPAEGGEDDHLAEDHHQVLALLTLVAHAGKEQVVKVQK